MSDMLRHPACTWSDHNIFSNFLKRCTPMCSYSVSLSIASAPSTYTMRCTHILYYDLINHDLTSTHLCTHVCNPMCSDILCALVLTTTSAPTSCTDSLQCPLMSYMRWSDYSIYSINLHSEVHIFTLLCSNALVRP